jgi:hypothetical protein
MNRRTILIDTDRPTPLPIACGQFVAWLAVLTLAGWLYLTAVDPRPFDALPLAPVQQLAVGLAMLVTAFVLTVGAAVGWQAWLAIRRWI